MHAGLAPKRDSLCSSSPREGVQTTTFMRCCAWHPWVLAHSKPKGAPRTRLGRGLGSHIWRCGSRDSEKPTAAEQQQQILRRWAVSTLLNEKHPALLAFSEEGGGGGEGKPTGRKMVERTGGTETGREPTPPPKKDASRWGIRGEVEAF